ncbi:MAG: hypothetical protein LBF19_00950 [Prevotellaceae bacterium]|jgi:hypothetical protein|nr:hypothetical protein [Prevotellaceae bacterium]
MIQRIFLFLFIFGVCLSQPAAAQNAGVMRTQTFGASDSSSVWSKARRLQVGGYGEAVMQRMFYSDSPSRYSYPERYKNESHGRMDLPHVIVYIGYDFGRGWKLGSEIEFEHGGAGTTYEIERTEAEEYETEIEKGGEVAIEQFWIEKSFASYANLRMGHIIVPVGLTNQHHMPTEFFSVLRPEEESAILPCTWHETGLSFWGRAGAWRYEALFVAGLDAERFSDADWIAGGATSPYEFKIANQYAGAIRIDNYSVKGLRLGVSGYYGYSVDNSLKSKRYERYNVKGIVTIGSLDAVYDDHHVLARANVVYGNLGGSKDISAVNKRFPSASPSPRTDVASDALSYYVEAGYDVLSFFGSRRHEDNRLYVYGHYGYYDSMYRTAEGIADKAWCERTIVSAGINYFPMKGLVIKAEYLLRKLAAGYNDEPMISLGVGYSGFFN